MNQRLHLGREVDPSGQPGARLDLDPSDLLTHALIVGMTGSGKTGLAVVLLEELLRQGVPVLAIDPKGDLGNLLLLFERYDAAAFQPWIDPEMARRQGQDVPTAAAAAAKSWSEGLAQWGLAEADAAALLRSREALIYTPGSRAGVPLSVLSSFEAPPAGADLAELREEVATLVSGLLALLHIEADPLRSREHILLSQIVEASWKRGESLSLEALIGAVAEPPFDKVGALPLETVFPRRDRMELMMALNGLLASPSFEAWREGEPLDVERLLRAPDGRPRLSIVYTSHLGDEERVFVTALLLEKVKGWMRRQSGTSALRAVLYMDEIYGYFPPHPANPPTKKPLLTLLKQARAQGLGVVLATQNPVDLDYKGLSNMGTWLVGRLQTAQDRERLREGLSGAGLEPGTVDRLLDGTKKRVFLLHDVHRPAPTLVESRWALSYLRGPLTREEVGRLMKDRQAAAPPAAAAALVATSPAAPASPAPAAPRPAPSGPPILPAGLDHNYFDRHQGEVADAHLLVKYAARYKGLAETITTRLWPLGGSSLMESFESEPLEVPEEAVQAAPPRPLKYSEPPSWLPTSTSRSIEKAIKDRLPDKLAFTQLQDPVTGAVSIPGESREAFLARLQAQAGGAKADKLREKLDKKKRDLQAREEEARSRTSEKWAAMGSAILDNIGIFGGKKPKVSSAGSVLSKNRMEDSAEARVEALKAEVAQFEEELARMTTFDAADLKETVVLPVRGGLKILRYDLVWVS